MQKTILITGCSSGIGLAAAKTLAQRGYRVFGSVRKAEDAAQLNSAGVESLLLDLTDSSSIQAGVAELLTRADGRIDALVNNAGYGQPGAVEDLSRATLRAQFETNVFGLQELTNCIIPVMRRQGYGRIVNLSSVLGLIALSYRGAYVASKFALEGLTDALRLELRHSGIQVSLIEPGPITSNFRDTARSSFEKNIDWQNSPHQQIYQRLLDNTEKNIKDSFFTQTPAAVIKKIIHALESPRPKIRYYVTLATYLLATFKRLLPQCWLDALLAAISRRETDKLP